jgi:hypothetical protein
MDIAFFEDVGAHREPGLWRLLLDGIRRLDRAPEPGPPLASAIAAARYAVPVFPDTPEGGWR